MDTITKYNSFDINNISFKSIEKKRGYKNLPMETPYIQSSKVTLVGKGEDYIDVEFDNKNKDFYKFVSSVDTRLKEILKEQEECKKGEENLSLSIRVPDCKSNDLRPFMRVYFSDQLVKIFNDKKETKIISDIKLGSELTCIIYLKHIELRKREVVPVWELVQARYNCKCLI